MSQNPHLDQELGTRHRAALGLVEESDAIVIIVSEETGKISLAMEGNLQRDLDYDKLRNLLTKAYHLSIK